MKVKITPGFLLLQMCAVLIIGIKCTLYAVISAAIHEIGHFAAIVSLRGKVSALDLSAGGAEIRYTGKMSYKSDFIIAIMGPVANIASAFLAAKLLPPYGVIDKNLFSGANMLYAAINLLPLSITDGGRALDALLCMTIGSVAAERTISALSLVFSLAIDLLGAVLLYYCGNPTLLFCGIFITRSVNLKSISTNSRGEKIKKLFK